jgi:SH3-like domain-containing protein
LTNAARPGKATKSSARTGSITSDGMTMRSLLLGLFFTILAVTVARAEMVSITGDNVNMRSGPGTKYRVLWELGKGFPLRVLDKRGNWLKVSDFENDTGWVYRKLTTHTPHLVVKVHKGTKRKINIRTGPGTRYKVVGQAYYGVVFRTMKRGRGWVKVKHESGLTGWIKRSLLWGW